MSQKNWDKTAEKQFMELDSEIQSDWGELRDITLR